MTKSAYILLIFDLLGKQSLRCNNNSGDVKVSTGYVELQAACRGSQMLLVLQCLDFKCKCKQLFLQNGRLKAAVPFH